LKIAHFRFSTHIVAHLKRRAKRSPILDYLAGALGWPAAWIAGDG
jgi:hypothetical protein